MLGVVDKPLKICKPNEDEIAEMCIPLCEEYELHIVDVASALIKRTLGNNNGKNIVITVNNSNTKNYLKKTYCCIIRTTQLLHLQFGEFKQALSVIKCKNRTPYILKNVMSVNFTESVNHVHYVGVILINNFGKLCNKVKIQKNFGSHRSAAPQAFRMFGLRIALKKAVFALGFKKPSVITL